MAQKVQRGAIVAQNDNGTLERVDGTSTYVGTATLPNGKVLTKRFRSAERNNDEVSQRWLAWQVKQSKRADEDEEDTMERALATVKKIEQANGKAKRPCPFSGCECGPACPVWSEPNGACAVKLGGIGLFNMAANIMRLDVSDSIELVALAVGELKSAMGSASARPAPAPAVKAAPTEADGIEAFLDGKGYIDFVNLNSKKVFADYKRACGEKYPVVREAELVSAIVGRFPELRKQGVHGGSVFKAA